MNNSALRHKIGTRIIWSCVNLRHFKDSMIVTGYDKDGDYMVKHEGSGAVGKCGVLARDVIAWDASESPGQQVNPRTQQANDCLGLSWEQIESMQGGKLRR